MLPWGTYSVSAAQAVWTGVHLHLAELSRHNHDFIRTSTAEKLVANIHTDCASGRLSCADVSIDAALLPRVLEHTPEPWLVLDEIRRVLKPHRPSSVFASCRAKVGAIAQRRGQVPNAGPYRLFAAQSVRRERGCASRSSKSSGCRAVTAKLRWWQGWYGRSPRSTSCGSRHRYIADRQDASLRAIRRSFGFYVRILTSLPHRDVSSRISAAN